AVEWLKVCLAQEPGHAQALWLLAALRWRAGDRAALAELAAAMGQREAADPRFRYMAAVCRLVAGDADGAREAARPLLNETGWQSDGQHLMGVIDSQRGDWAAAAVSLGAVVQANEGPLADHARALLGRANAQRGNVINAVEHWLAVPEE